MRALLMTVIFLTLAACSNRPVQVSRSQHFEPHLQSQQLYIAPFKTVMVPEEVSSALFNHFIDQLNQADSRVEFIILKQGLEQIDPNWLAGRDYLTGEIYAYVEEIGSSVTDIRARGRIRLYQPGQPEAVLELTLPAESFHENDYSSLQKQRLELAIKIASELAKQLLDSLSQG